MMTEDDVQYIQGFINNLTKRIDLQEESNAALKKEVVQLQDFITNHISGSK